MLYHLGGLGDAAWQKHYQRWPRWLFDTKMRDIGVPLVSQVSLLGFGIWTPWALVSGLFLFFALTTYCKKKGAPALWWNWLLTGLLYGVAWGPFCLFSGRHEQFFWYTLNLGIWTTIFSESISSTCWEEFSRGALIVGLQLLFLVKG